MIDSQWCTGVCPNWLQILAEYGPAVPIPFKSYDLSVIIYLRPDRFDLIWNFAFRHIYAKCG